MLPPRAGCAADTPRGERSRALRVWRASRGPKRGALPGGPVGKDLGLVFNYYSGSAKKAAVYWSDSASRIAFASDASESSSLITATTYATILAGGLEINNACTGGTDEVISCVGGELALSNIVFDGGSF